MVTEASSSRITVVVDDRIARIILGDGTRRNALCAEDWSILRNLVESIAASGSADAIILHGRGDTFCSGSDLEELAGADLAAIDRAFRDMELCFRALERVPVPVIAAIEGVAAGAGCQLGLAADLAIMADSARIGMPVARLAIQASAAFVARVADRTGKAVAADLYLSGRLLSGSEAQHRGLVARVVPSGSAVASATALASEISPVPTEALTAVKIALAGSAPTLVSSADDDLTVSVSKVDREPLIAAVQRFFHRADAGPQPECPVGAQQR